VAAVAAVAQRQPTTTERATGDTMADAAETIEASGRRIGHHAWVEMRLFETLGRWSGTVADPRAKALLAAQSHHHAWHAEQWHALLPALPHLAAADLVAPSEATSELVATLAELDEVPAPADDTAAAPDDVSRLAAIYRVALPRVAAAYREHLALTTPVTDGPTMRTLGLVLADLDADIRAGLDLLAELDGRA
jgi:hypothetical protein